MANTYEPVIGLEIHAELSTATKLFCACRNDPFHAPEPNIYICPVCLGLPGALPVMNREALDWTIKVGLALGCQIGHQIPDTGYQKPDAQFSDGEVRHPASGIRHLTKWDRKNYFYPDLPKGYQISQYDLPICHGGTMQLPPSTAYRLPPTASVAITRIHLEEDTGKLVHPPQADYSLIDYNRSGVPLLELVTEPEITSGAEAAAFAHMYQLVLRTLGVATADMEKGGMRVEVNISLRQKTEDRRQKTELGTKVEIKNLNSFRSVERAIEFEIGRQSQLLDRGEKVVQETHGWNEDRGETFSQRTKETAADYRYFPEPDLPPIAIGGQETARQQDSKTARQPIGGGSRSGGKSAIDIESIRKELPEMPWETLGKLAKIGVAAADAERLVFDPQLLASYQVVAQKLRDHPEQLRQVASLIVNRALDDPELIRRVASQEVSLPRAKQIQQNHRQSGTPIAELLTQSSANSQLTDARLTDILEETLAANPAAVADYRAGKAQALSFLVGAVMAKTRGAADPGKINQKLRATLEKEG